MKMFGPSPGDSVEQRTPHAHVAKSDTKSVGQKLAILKKIYPSFPSKVGGLPQRIAAPKFAPCHSQLKKWYDRSQADFWDKWPKHYLPSKETPKALRALYNLKRFKGPPVERNYPKMWDTRPEWMTVRQASSRRFRLFA